MPRLVVAMPAYNAEATIRRAALSTLRAMPKDSELLVFDDNSADGTLAILDGIEDSRIRVIASPRNIGGGSARRRMLAESDSEYIAAMDADDVTLPWRFVLQINALECNDAVFSSALRFDSRGRMRPSAPVPLKASEFPAALLFHNPVWHPSLLARRSSINEAGGYGAERCAQDYDLWLKMALTGARMHRLGTPVVAYRQSATQVSQSSGYIDNVSRFQGLRESYLSLYLRRVDVDRIPMVPNETQVSVDTIAAGLRSQLLHLSSINRLHYSYLLRSDRSRDWLTRIFPS